MSEQILKGILSLIWFLFSLFISKREYPESIQRVSMTEDKGNQTKVHVVPRLGLLNIRYVKGNI